MPHTGPASLFSPHSSVAALASPPKRASDRAFALALPLSGTSLLQKFAETHFVCEAPSKHPADHGARCPRHRHPPGPPVSSTAGPPATSVGCTSPGVYCLLPTPVTVPQVSRELGWEGMWSGAREGAGKTPRRQQLPQSILGKAEVKKAWAAECFLQPVPEAKGVCLSLGRSLCMQCVWGEGL